MEKEINRVLDKAVEMGWITINPNFRRDVLAKTMLDVFIKDMKVIDLIAMYSKYNP